MVGRRDASRRRSGAGPSTRRSIASTSCSRPTSTSGSATSRRPSSRGTWTSSSPTRSPSANRCARPGKDGRTLDGPAVDGVHLDDGLVADPRVPRAGRQRRSQADGSRDRGRGRCLACPAVQPVQREHGRVPVPVRAQPVPATGRAIRQAHDRRQDDRRPRAHARHRARCSPRPASSSSTSGSMPRPRRPTSRPCSSGGIQPAGPRSS